MKRKIKNEKFYTTKDNAILCLKNIDIDKYDLIVEPSAGNGSFSSLIPGCVAMDIEPEADGIEKRNFFTYMPDPDKYKKILTIGNPPFGRQSSLATRFINHAALFSDTIAFILPNSFYKESMIKRLDKRLTLLSSIRLDNITFIENEKLKKIPCSFFIFSASNGQRREYMIYATNDFTFVDKNDNPDNSIIRVGGNAGHVEGPDASYQTHYFVKWNNPKAKTIIENIKWNYNNTVGPRSISKNEIIIAYLKEIGQFQEYDVNVCNDNLF